MQLSISEKKWIYVEQLAEEYANNNPGIYRYGDRGLAVCNL